MGNKYRLGIPQSQETREKISRFNKGKTLSLEHRNKISNSNKGIIKNLKFSETEIIEIRKLFKNGMRKTKIGKIFNVGRGTIFNIISGKTYKHIQEI